MWFPENCAMQTHCPSFRHISKALVQGPLKCSLNSESHRPGGTESQGEEVLRHKEVFASRRRWNERCRPRTCEHIVTMSPIPIGWKQKGTIAPPPEPLIPHLQTLPRDPSPRALSLSGWIQSPTLQEGDQGEQFPEIQDRGQATFPMSQGLATFWSNGDQEDQDDFMTNPKCQNECQTSFYFFLYLVFVSVVGGCGLFYICKCTKK